MKTETLCYCWKITHLDGRSFCYTDNSSPLLFLGDTYTPIEGVTTTTISKPLGLSVDNLESAGSFTDEVTLSDVSTGSLAHTWLRRRVMQVIAAIKAVWAELLTPSDNETPYVRGVVGISHAVLGRALMEPMGWSGAAIAAVLFVAYWLAKERGDLLRGGAWRDGVQDACFVAMGALYVTPYWALLVTASAGVVMIASEWFNEARK